MTATSIPNQVRLWLADHPGFHKPADIAEDLRLERKAVSSAVSKLVSKDRLVREDGKVADPKLADVGHDGQIDERGDSGLPTESPVNSTISPELGTEAVEANEKTSPDPIEEPLATMIHEYGSRDFPGNYSIVLIPFTQDLADAFGDITVREERFPGKLVRRAHFAGPSEDHVRAFQILLERELNACLKALHEWQKENKERRRTLTDMQKFLEHREFIAQFGKEAAARVRAA